MKLILRKSLNTALILLPMTFMIPQAGWGAREGTRSSFFSRILSLIPPPKYRDTNRVTKQKIENKKTETEEIQSIVNKIQKRREEELKQKQAELEQQKKQKQAELEQLEQLELKQLKTQAAPLSVDTSDEIGRGPRPGQSFQDWSDQEKAKQKLIYAQQRREILWKLMEEHNPNNRYPNNRL